MTAIFEAVDNKYWRVTEKFCCNLPGNSYQCVEEGTLTDFASIPRLFWPIVGHPATKSFQKPAAIHDKLCAKAWEKGKYTERQFADAAFSYLLAEEGVPYWKRSVMYLGVRLCGFVCYSLPKSWIDGAFSFFN